MMSKLNTDRRWLAMGIAVLAMALSGVVVAVAGDSDRGWSSGQMAAGVPRVLGATPERVVVELPDSLGTLTGPTLLVYFSPTCPHCQHVTPELQRLADGMVGRAEVVGIASGTSTRESIEEFRTSYGAKFRIVRDESHEIVSAMGARSTPSALLLRPEGDEWVVIDAWYPYVAGTATLVRMRLADDPWSVFEPGVYHGTVTCGACHVHEADSWRLTHHSIAWRTLVTRGESENEECVGCHVTGYGQAGGWTSDSESDLLVDVTCESCHGPAGPHDGVSVDPRDSCVGCHDAKHSIAFTVDKGIPLIDHYRSAAMSVEEWQAARLALYEGKVPRDLLAFADGPTEGAVSCATCHPAEHAHWKNTPHANAMLTLPKASRSDPTCVRCHATPTYVGGPQARDDVTAFRVDDGVGCESCHGPGHAHVIAEGGQGNIEALGEDCPVCVIEAVCTGCHTREHDPGWDLETRLPNVRHGPNHTEGKRKKKMAH